MPPRGKQKDAKAGGNLDPEAAMGQPVVMRLPNITMPCNKGFGINLPPNFSACFYVAFKKDVVITNSPFSLQPAGFSEATPELNSPVGRYPLPSKPQWS